MEASSIIRHHRIAADLDQISSSNPFPFALRLPESELNAKFRHVPFEEIERRLVRLRSAVRVIESRWTAYRARREAQTASSIRRVVVGFLVARMRQTVEAKVSGKVEKFRKLRAYAERRQGQKIRAEELQLAFSKLRRVCEAVLLARLNFGLFMIKDYQDPLFPSMLHRPHLPKNSILGEDFANPPPHKHRLPIFPKYLDALHALIFKNFRQVGRTQGLHEMAVQFCAFTTRAKVFYKLVAIHNENC